MGIADPKTRKQYWKQLASMCSERETSRDAKQNYGSKRAWI